MKDYQKHLESTREDYRQRHPDKVIKMRVEAYLTPNPLRQLTWLNGTCLRCRGKMYSVHVADKEGVFEQLICPYCGERV